MAIKDIFKKSKEAEKQPEKKGEVVSAPEKEANEAVKKEITDQAHASERKKKTADAYKILSKPLVTEKATHLGESNKYVFEVAPDANKIEIKKAIFDVYGKNPLAVNIIKIKGKKIRYGKTSGKRKNRKKAIVTLRPGEMIKIYEGV